MPFQYTWELDFSGEGTPMPSWSQQGTVGPDPQYLFDLSPHYYVPSIDITVASGLDGYYDYTISGAETPVGVSVYFPNNSEVTWSIGLYSDVPINGLRIEQDKYGKLLEGNHTGTGREFFSFDPLRTNYRDIWVVTSSPKVRTDIVFRSANKYYITASGKYDSSYFIPTEASGNTLTSLTCMANVLPTDWSVYHPYYFDYYREPTVSGSSGSLIINFDVEPHYEKVYGGSSTCSGSHYSELIESIVLPNISGSIGLASFTYYPSYYTVQAKEIGDALGISPNKIKKGLLAWHPLQPGPFYEDRSGNEVHASGVGNLSPIIGKHGYGAGLGYYPYGHIEVPLDQQEDDYMVSFWFKPNQLLTSGVDNSFVIMKSDDFYGDHFRDSFDYLTYPRFKGWEVLGSPITCSAGFENDYLRFQGEGYTDWSGATWTASTLWFDIPKSQDWTVQTRFNVAGTLHAGQAAGFIFFNEFSYLDYCSLIIQGDLPDEAEYQYLDDIIPPMTSANTPAPYVITSDDYLSNNMNYHAWHAFESSYGGYYYHSQYGMPTWVRIDLGADTNQVIQGYRIRQGPNAYYPKNWTFQGSDNGSTWVTLHTMVNQPQVGAGNWGSWFTFSNETTYRYYRFYITASNSSYYASWDGTEFLVKNKSAISVDANIKVQTEDLSYTIDEHASVSGTWIFEMHKRGDYVWFGYREDTETTLGNITPIYRMDVSLWGDDMRLGLQSRNPDGPAPEVMFDYFRFQKGKMPDGVGDPEEPGRFLLTYNEVDVGDSVEERTDSRLWLMTSRSGVAYGTAHYRWEPDEWYLIQAGVRPGAGPNDMNEGFCWWVNARQQKGLVVGSGTGGDVFLVENQPLSYFDPEPYTTSSGMFQLDEVSHWNRWLTDEEILKMLNKVSQISWHATEPYLEREENFLTIDTTNSGFETLVTVPKTTEFEYFTHYQAPLPPQLTVQLEKISYRIQKNLSVAAWQLEPKEISILRMSSGWMSGNNSCYCLWEWAESAEILDPPVSASSNYVYSSEVPMNMFDGSVSTLWSTGRSPIGVTVNVMFSYDKITPWFSFRLRSSSNTTYWDDDFAKDINVYGSNEDSPVRDTNDDWEFQFQVTVPLPTGPAQWSDWVELPSTVQFKHYKLHFINNTYDSGGNWIRISEMEIKSATEEPTIYGLMDVRGDVAVVTRAFDYPTFDLLEITIPRQVTFDLPQITTSGAEAANYKAQSYDSTAPIVYTYQPRKNARFVHPDLDWFVAPRIAFDIREYGDAIYTPYTRAWIKRQGYGYHRTNNIDTFSTYELDLGATLSGHGWSLVNPEQADRAHINRNFTSTVCLDYGDIVASGVEECPTSSGLEDSLEIMRRWSNYYSPLCNVGGTAELELTTTSGVWKSTQKSAPYVNFTVPSGITEWSYETSVVLNHRGDPRGISAGIMISDQDTGDFYHLLRTTSGVICRAQESPWDGVPFALSVADGQPIWLKVEKTQTEFSFYWSEDNDIWNECPPFVPKYPMHEALTGYGSPEPYNITYVGTVQGSCYPWKAFDLNPNTCVSLSASPCSIQLDFGEEVCVAEYIISTIGTMVDATNTYDEPPLAWRLEASNDQILYTLLDDNNNTELQDGAHNEYHIRRVYSLGFYRYYKITWYNFSQFGEDAGTIVSIRDIKFYGLDSSIPLEAGHTYEVGLVTLNDSSSQITPEPNIRLIPEMSGNSSVPGYVASASIRGSDAYKAFDRNSSTYWQVHPINEQGNWIQVEFPTQVRPKYIRSYRNAGMGSSPTWQSWALYGSNNGSDFTEIQAYNHSSARGELRWWPLKNNSAVMAPVSSGTGYFKYLRWQITDSYTGGTNTYHKIYMLDVYGSEKPDSFTENYESYATASFGHSKFVTEQEGAVVPMDQGWELMVFGDEVQNSATNSGVSFFTETDVDRHLIEHELKNTLVSHEHVYVRVQARDFLSFRVDYPMDEMEFFIAPSGQPRLPFTETLGYYTPSGSYYLLDATGNYTISGGYGMATTTEAKIGTTAIDKFNSVSNLRVCQIPADIMNNPWTFDFWYRNSTAPAGNIMDLMNYSTVSGTTESGTPTVYTLQGTNDLTVSFSGSNITVRQQGELRGVVPITPSANTWTHVAIDKEDRWLSVLFDGYRAGYAFLDDSTLTPSGTTSLQLFEGYTGLLDMVSFRNTKKWDNNIVRSNILDEIYMFTAAGWSDFGVDITPIADVEPPVCVPVSPLPNASGVCPASGIKFDILDDYSGVSWDNLVVKVDSITVYSGGNNMTVWYPDRGTLVIEDRGQKDGELVRDFPQGASGTEIITDGVNRLLYPPGTVYSGSGAWGKRFTYYVDEDTQIEFFDYRMNITVTGTDNRGYLSQFDAIEPNSFGYDYSFDFITNDNIKMGNFFMDVGESERIDIMQAKGRHIWVDLWDTDYPTTDIKEDECYLRFYDGVVDFVCSGTWWTTYTGTKGTASGIRVHRLHYDAGDYYWDGHRTMHWEVHAQNDNPMCHVYNRDEYQLCYGWHLFWLHHDRIPPFEFNKKLPVFVSIKTQDYVPSRFSKSYMIWTAPAGTHDFNVGIRALPLGAGNELEVDILAHSHYLQYSEDVDVELYCKDRDGNELLYTWTFTTEDEPEN